MVRLDKVLRNELMATGQVRQIERSSVCMISARGSATLHAEPAKLQAVEESLDDDQESAAPGRTWPHRRAAGAAAG